MARPLPARRNHATVLRLAPRRPICVSASDLARLRCCEVSIALTQFLPLVKLYD
jgi:hypothetical protein